VSRLGRLRAQETLLRAELAIAKLKAAIARERVSSALSTAPSGLVVLPEVRSVGGLARQVHAVVQYPDGSRMTVRAGSILANGIRVIRVQRRGVWVRLPAGQVRALGFAPGSLPALQTPGAPFIPARAGGAGVSSGPGGPG
jgi:type IV pilus biogenesis protein PilP